ncbi:transcription factor E2F3 isoform X2 [Thalassophryne amazonica]|uniref:transcription factor E2F3 isoform X2 n=1 Tax=Thalassophryne amazonica TaxID=390379 RepID=UPI001470C163|nr:transcription factor E2F3 isoform X2 [Thalassophryne amazonica]
MKCIVSGCPNRAYTVHLGSFSRPPKRFFSFPTEPARVKVWLAALREMDKLDSVEQHVICEDHFLREDISVSGVSSDAIPLMPPCLEGPLGLINPWGADSSEEEEPWSTAGDDDAVEGGDEAPAVVEPPAPKLPPPPNPSGSSENQSEAKITSGTSTQSEETNTPNVSLATLTRRFLELMTAAPDTLVDTRQVAMSLHICKRRVFDITNILEGINLIQRKSGTTFVWTGTSPISQFLWRNQQRLHREMQNLKLVEETLDGLIKSCAQQLFKMTDDLENSTLAYVTHEDIRRLRVFQEQTVIFVKAPEETKLEVPAPKEDSIQVHLKGGKGPIMVLTCDMGPGDTVTSDPGQKSGCFITLEESRIKTAALHTESSSLQSAVQSA